MEVWRVTTQDEYISFGGKTRKKIAPSACNEPFKNYYWCPKKKWFLRELCPFFNRRECDNYRQMCGSCWELVIHYWRQKSLRFIIRQVYPTLVRLLKDYSNIQTLSVPKYCTEVWVTWANPNPNFLLTEITIWISTSRILIKLHLPMKNLSVI